MDGVPINQLHGSDSTDNAQKEIEYFFGPVEQTVAVIKPEAFQTQGRLDYYVVKMCCDVT